MVINIIFRYFQYQLLVLNLIKKVSILKKVGPNTILSVTEGDKIVWWIWAKAKVGSPVHPENIKDSIQKILKSRSRKNPFNDDNLEKIVNFIFKKTPRYW